ncbi:unnamed protein product [Phaedon cochleariae]|uniref:p53 DNA-binding domain-containing protein n=1 Tax=Phaedon cochleariae TaxID=80249 RepID=A0A9P0DTW7_PHACE|nr:unnamed protein product [Phaedon cochleariae]
MELFFHRSLIKHLTMSSQSDILSPDDQQYLFSEIDMVHVADIDLFPEEPTLDVADDFLTDVKINHPQPLPPAAVVLPNEEECGPYGFEVDIIPNKGSKNAWVYSAALNKVYMTMRSPFPVDFKVKTRPPFDLFIRSTPVYSSPQFAQDCVYRCLNHEFSVEKDRDRDLMDHIRPHIIRCANKATMYLGDKSKNERLSVVIPFPVPQNPSVIVRELYEFVCTNSCPVPGINRRTIEVIFTLEDYTGKIYGRKSLNVRVCSCPKRDKEKDEKDNLENGQPPQGKKRKLEKPPKRAVASTDDFKEFSITIPLVGKHNEQHVLKYCHDLMAGEILKHTSSGTEGPYRIVRNKINAMMKDRTD